MALYTLSDIAKELNVAPSTLRYQAQQYAELLPMRKVEGERWPKYEEEALPILKTIMGMVAQGKNREEVKDAIYSQTGIVYRDDTQIAVKGQINEPQTTVHPLATDLMELLKQQAEIIRMKNQVIEELRKSNEEMRNELVFLKGKMRVDNVFRRFGL